LSMDELKRLGKLTKTDFNQLNAHQRALGPQISFDRPELSPCLKKLEKESDAYKEALNIINIGNQRLKDTPRAEMEGFKPVKEQRDALQNYVYRLNKENKFRQAIVNGEKKYDEKD